MRYYVALIPDDNGTILATVPDIPGAITFGDDREDALARATDAIETMLMAVMANREAIPVPKFRSRDPVDLSALTSAKVELYAAMREDGIGKAALARRLAVAMPQVDRLLDLRHRSRLDAIERAFAVLGRSVSLVVKAAA